MLDYTDIRSRGSDAGTLMLNAAFGALVVGWATFLLIPRSNRLANVLHGSAESAESHSMMDLVKMTRVRRSTSEQDFARDLRALASELRSGAPSDVALVRAAGKQVSWPRALAAARFGDLVDDGFIRDANENPQLAGYLRQLAACWRVSSTQGSGLSTSIERLGMGVKSQMELLATLDSELAAPRATGRLLSFLPVVGIGMAYLLGADPLAWFTGTLAGALTFALAVALTAIGMLWSRRIVRRVEAGLR